MSDEVMTLCAVIRAREGHEARVEAALGRLFEANDLVLDAEEIFDIGRAVG